MNPYQVFHSSNDELRKRLHIILVRPEQSTNVGAALRAAANMGMRGSFFIVGSPHILDDQCRRVAKHARARIEAIRFFDDLGSAIAAVSGTPQLTLAATARIGSSSRPHPLRVRTAAQRAMGKLRDNEIGALTFVFGPESDGLSNSEVDLCDWVVTIPSSDEYRSLNLAQALLIFCYEANLTLLEEWAPRETPRHSQKEKLILHVIRLAEAVGFVLPGDPFKMKPRLEEILASLPPHIKDAKTLHGLLDQAIRSVKKGGPDIRGRFVSYIQNGGQKEHSNGN